MTLRQTVDLLRGSGIEVNFRVRPDGGIVITGIGGTKYKGRTGNIAARQIANAPMSSAAQSQRVKVSRAGMQYKPSGKPGIPGSYKRGPKLQPLPPIVKNELRKVQRIFRKLGQTAGSPTTKNVRKALERGETVGQVLESLSQAERYARNLAPIQDLQALKLYADSVYLKTGMEDIGKGARSLERVIQNGGQKAYTQIVRDAHDYLYTAEEYYEMKTDISIGAALNAARNFYETVKLML